MFAAAASKLLSYLLGEYVEELESHQLELAILSGNATVTDLRIKKTALSQHNIPIEISKGTIHRVDITIPWKNMFSKPNYFDIDEIFVLGKVKGNVLLESVDNMRSDSSEELEAICAHENINKESLMSGIMIKLINKLEATISKVHIRIEGEENGQFYTFGINVPLIKVTTIDCPGESNNETFRKQLTLHDFSIYLDTQAVPIDQDNFRRSITREIASHHQFIVKDLTFTAIMESYKNSNGTIEYQFHLDTPGFDTFIDDSQWKIAVDLLGSVTKFDRIMNFISNGRPTKSLNTPESMVNWWHYANRCAFKIRNPLRFSPQKALLFLRSRREMLPFLTEYIQSPSKDKYKTKIKNHQDFFGPDIFLGLAAYAKRQIILEQQKKMDINISSDVLRKIALAGAKFKADKHLKLDFIINKISLVVQNMQKKHLARLSMNDFRGQIAFEQSISKFAFNISGVTGSDCSLEAVKDFFKMVPKEGPAVYGFIEFTPQSKSGCLSIISPRIDFNVSLFQRLSNFFSGLQSLFIPKAFVSQKERRDATLLEAEHIIKNHIKPQISFKIEDFQIKMPDERDFIVQFDNVILATSSEDVSREPEVRNTNTYYDKFIAEISNFQALIGESTLITPFSTKAIVESIFIPMKSVPSIKIGIDLNVLGLRATLDEINIIQHMFEVATSVIPHSEGVHKPVKNENPSGIEANVNLEAVSLSLVGENAIKFELEKLFASYNSIKKDSDIKLEVNKISGFSDSHQTSFKVGSDKTKGLSVNATLGDEIEAKVNIRETDISTTFRFLLELATKFSSNENDKEEENNTKTKIKADIIMEETKMNFQIPSDNGITTLVVDMSLLNGSMIKQNEMDMKVCINDLLLSSICGELFESQQMNIRYQIGEEDYFDVSIPYSKFIMQPIAYILVMQFSDYINFCMDYYFPTTPGKDSTFNFRGILSRLDCLFYEESDHYLTIGFDEMDIKFAKSVSDITTKSFDGKLPDGTPYVNGGRFDLNYSKRCCSIKMEEPIQCNLHQRPTNFLYLLFMEKPKDILIHDKYFDFMIDPNLPSIIADILMKNIHADLITDKILASSDFDEVKMKVILDEPKVHCFIWATNMKLETNQLDAIHNFVFCEKLDFEMVEDNIIINMPSLSLTYQQQYFLDVMHFMSGMATDRNADKRAPVMLPLFRYFVDIGELNFRMLPRPPITKNDGIFMKMGTIKLKTDDLMLNLSANIDGLEATSYKGDPMFNLQNFNVGIKLVTSTEVPPMTPGYDSSLIDLFSNPSKPYLHSVDITVPISNMVKYEYHRASAVMMCNAFCSFLDFEVIIKEPFPIVFNIDAIVDDCIASFPDVNLTASVKGIDFKMRKEGQHISIKEMTMVAGDKTIFRQKEITEDPICIINNSDTILSVDLGDSIVYADLEIFTKLLKEIFYSPFMLTQWGMDKEIPSPIVVKAPKLICQIPLNDDGLSAVLRFALKCTLLGEDLDTELNDLYASVAYKNNAQMPIVNKLNFRYIDEYKDDYEHITYSIHRAKLYLSQVDVVALALLLKSIDPIMECLDFDKQKKKEIITKGKEMHLDIGELSAVICQCKTKNAVHGPLFRFGTDKLSVDIGRNPSSFSSTIKYLECYNPNIKRWDQLIEPFAIAASVENGERLWADLTIPNLNVNVSYVALKSLMLLSDCLKSKSVKKPETPLFVVQNDLGVKAKFNYKGEDFELVSGEKKVYDMIEENEILTFELEKKKQSVSLQFLQIPFYLMYNVIAYSTYNGSTKTIVISSLLKFVNKTGLPINILMKQGRNKFILSTRVEPGQSSMHPFSKSNECQFAIANTPGYEKRDHMVFTLSQLKNGPIPITCLIADMPVLFILKPKVVQGGVTVVKVAPTGVIHNLIPDTLRIKLRDSEYEISVGKHIHTNLLHGNIKQVMASAALGKNPFPTPLPISLSSDAVSVIPVQTKQRAQPLMLAVRVSVVGMQVSMSVYSPAIVYDRTGFKLMCHGTNTSRFQGKDEYRRLYWSEPTFFEKTKKLPIKFAAKNLNKHSQPIECLGIGDNERVFVPISSSVDIFLPVSYNISSAAPFAPSSVITLYPSIEIENKLANRICLIPTFELNGEPTGHSISVDPNTRVPIKIATKNLSFNLTFADKKDIIPITLSNPIHTTLLLKDGSLIEVNARKIGITLNVILKEAQLPQPIMITNLLTETVFFYQKNSEVKQEAPSRTTAVVGFENITSQTLTLEINAYGASTLIDAIPGNKATAGIFCVEVVPKDQHLVIVVSREPVEQMERPIRLAFSVGSLSLALIDSKPREIALLTVTGIQAEFINKDSGEGPEIMFAAHTIELDDLHPQAPFDVVLLSSNQDKHGCINIAGKMQPKTKNLFQSLDIQISPIALLGDISFISDISVFFESLIPKEKASRSLKGLLPSTNTKPKSSFSSKEIRISQLLIFISLEKTTGRPKQSNKGLWYLSLIPSIREGTISLPPVTLDNVSSSDMNNSQLQNYIREIIKQCIKLVFNVDIFMNIGGVASSIGHSLTSLPSSPIRAIGQLTVGTALTAGESILVSASKLVHMAVPDDRAIAPVGLGQNAGGTIKEGFGSLAGNFAGAITGIVSDPINGAKDDGVFGFCRGVGKAIFGLVLKPVSGIVDASTGIVSGAKKAVEGRTIVHKIRPARVFPNGRIVPYNEVLANLQSIVQAYSSSAVTINYVIEDISGKIGVIGEESLYVINNNKVIKDFPTAQITSLVQEDNHLEVTIGKKGNKIKFSLPSIQRSSEAGRFILSVANYSISNLHK